MATILMEHGYLFPVIDRLSPIKDDGTLYRFQVGHQQTDSMLPEQALRCQYEYPTM